MEFKVLGPMEVTDGGRRLELRAGRHRVLLASLLIQANRVIPVDDLVEQLWGGHPPATAAATLQGYVAAVRRALEPDCSPRTPPKVLLTRSPGYLLCIPTDAVDSARFEALVTEGRELVASGHPRAGRRLLTQALDLWRGTPYADLDHERSIGWEVARLEALRAVAAEARVEADLAVGDHTAAVAELEHLVAAEPLRERRWELYVLALYRCGRQAEALRALSRARRILTDGFGDEPRPALRQLEHGILHCAPGLDRVPLSENVRPLALSRPTRLTAPGADPPRRPDTGISRSRLVGREEESAVLDATLEALAAKSGGLLEVAGEPGIGKSRLLVELAARAERYGFTVLAGRAAELEHQAPFGVFADALDFHLASHGPELLARLGPQAVAELATAFPSLAPLAAGREPALQAERYRTHRAVRTLIEWLGRKQPTVVLLDDVHWADPASRELLIHLLAYPPAAPSLLALAFRPAQTAPALAQALATAHRDGRTQRIGLEPLTCAEAAELIGPSNRHLLDDLYRESGGNPFYLEQLARTAGEGGTSGAAVRVGAVTVPPAVRAALVAELDGLAGPARRLIEGAAVAGDPFDADLAARAAGLHDDDVLGLLDALLAADVVRPTSIPRRFRFRHPILRRAVYETAGGGWRLGAHARAAVALAADGAPVAVRAHHVEHSATPGDEKAITLLVEAGDATASRAPVTAAHWYHVALRLLADGDHRRCQLLVARATALGAAGQLEESRAGLVQALALLSPGADEPWVDVVCFCAMVEHLLGRHQQAETRLAEALAQLPSDRTQEASRLKIELSVQASVLNDFARGRLWAADVLAGSDTSDDDLVRAHAMALVAYNDYCLGSTALALDEVAQVTARFDRLSDETVAHRLAAAYFIAWTELALERFDDALRHCKRALAISRATGQGHYVLPITQAEVMALIIRGRIRRALDLATTAVEAGRLSGHDQALANVLLFLSWAAAWAGDLQLGIAAGEEGLELVRDLDESVLTAGPVVMFTLALVEAGQFARARDAMLAALNGPDLPLLGRIGRSAAYEVLTRAALALGLSDEAGEWADRAEAATHGFSLPVEAAPARRARARVLLAQGEWGPAAEILVPAADAAEAGGSLIQAAQCRLLAGTALARLGERERALALVERAETDFAGCGALGFREEAVAQLRRLGRRRDRRPAGRRASGLGALTAREREIAELVVTGCSNRQIGVACYLSTKTVERHISHIFAKLGVSSRAALAGIVAAEPRGEPTAGTDAVAAPPPDLGSAMTAHRHLRPPDDATPARPPVGGNGPAVRAPSASTVHRSLLPARRPR